VGHFFDRYDWFSQNVSSFNIEGQTQVGSCIGLGFSIFISILVLAYAIIKGKMMVFKERPLIATFNEKGVRTLDNEHLSLKDLRF
jgi:hypothetical protein